MDILRGSMIPSRLKPEQFSCPGLAHNRWLGLAIDWIRLGVTDQLIEPRPNLQCTRHSIADRRNRRLPRKGLHRSDQPLGHGRCKAVSGGPANLAGHNVALQRSRRPGIEPLPSPHEQSDNWL